MASCEQKECKEFSYGGDLSVPLDYVRFIVGDTSPNYPMLDDREIESALSINANDPIKASLLMLNGLIAKYSLLSDVKIGPVSKSFKGIAAALQSRADELEKDNCIVAIPSFPAGVSDSGDGCCPSVKRDGRFTMNMFDNDGSGYQTRILSHLGYLARYGE